MRYVSPDKRISGKLLRWSQRKYRTNARCFYCGVLLVYKPLPNQRTKDHVYPRSKGGKNGLHNIVNSCRRCNNLKSSMTLAEFRRISTGLRDGKFWAEKQYLEAHAEERTHDAK